MTPLNDGLVNMLNRLAAALFAAAIPSMAQAQAEAACLSRAEANALFTYALPDLIDGIRNKCSASLPAAAFLPSQGGTLVARYRSGGTTSWALARQGFTKMVGTKGDMESKMMAAMPDEALKGLLGTAFAVAVTDDIKLQDCSQIDRFVAALSPLPASNVAEIITGLMVLGGADKSNEFKICKDS